LSKLWKGCSGMKSAGNIQKNMQTRDDYQQYSGNRIVPVTTPGMATCHPFQRKPKAFQRSVFLESLNRVLTACRRIAAFWPQPGTDYPLVNFDQHNKGKREYALNR
jgi:hypothetical protein